MSNVKNLYTDKELVIQCVNLLGLTNCEVRSQKEDVVLKGSGVVFDPINNVNDWGVLINAMLEAGFDLALDHNGIIASTAVGMLTFNDKSVGRRLARAFVELHSQNHTKKDVRYAKN